MSIKNAREMTIKKEYLFFAAYIVHMLIWVVNLPFSQLQLRLFGRRILTWGFLGTLECGLLITIFLLSFKHIRLRKLSFATSKFVVLAMLLGLIAMTLSSYASTWTFMNFFLYWMVPFVFLIAFDQVQFDTHSLQKILLVIIIIHAVMILLQKATGSIIWPYEYNELGEQLFYIGTNYYNMDGLVRCPGICISGLNAGIMLIFGWGILWITEFKRKIWRWLLALLFGVAILFTGTRNIYITAIYVLIYVFIYCHTSGKWRIILCNGFMVLSTVLYISFFQIIGQLYFQITKNILTDTFSATIRINNWAAILEKIEDGSILQILFGQLAWQPNVVLNIDNLFLEVFMAIGLVGLVAFCLYFLYMHNYLLAIDDNRFALLLGFVSAFFIYGTANVFENLYMALIVIAVCICSNYRNKVIEKRG